MRADICARFGVGVALAAAAAAQDPSFSRTAESCRELVSTGSNDPAALYRAGLCFEEVRDLASAVNAYRQAGSLGFQPATATVRQAGIFLVTGQPERALAEIRRAPEQDCGAPKMHQLDFWIGEWDLSSGGRRFGTSRVEPVIGGCALLERLTRESGEVILTLLFYDPVTRKWHAHGANKAESSESSGEFTEGAMHLSGTRPFPHRRTVSPRTTANVRHNTETPAGGGAGWTTVRDVNYVRRK